MFIRIHRSPEGADSAGTAEVATVTDSHTPETSTPEGSPAAKPETQAPEKQPVNEAKVLAALLKKKPNYQATPEEIDIFDKYTAGKLKPEKDEGEPEETEDAPEAEKPKETKAPVSELMKELNAKSEAEILEKVRELKKFTGSRDAQAYKTLEQKHQALERDSRAEMQLWADLKDARSAPKAIAYLESQLQAAKARHGIQAQPKGEPTKTLIDRSKFTVPEEAEVLEAVLGTKFGEFQSIIEKQAEVIRRLEEKDNKRDTEHQLSRAQAEQLDEFVDVAAMIPNLKSVAGLRDKVSKWLQDPAAEVTELQVLDRVMAEANKEKVSLRVAWKMVEADMLREQIAGAEDRGQRKAFNHKPNNSLSDMQGKATATYTNYTDAQLKSIESGKTPIPLEWLDKSGSLDPAKMPERARKLLLSLEEG